MPGVREGWRRLLWLVRRGELESGLDEEIRFHIEGQTQKNLQAGMSPEEARRQALIKFGGVRAHARGRARPVPSSLRRGLPSRPQLLGALLAARSRLHGRGHPHTGLRQRRHHRHVQRRERRAAAAAAVPGAGTPDRRGAPGAQPGDWPALRLFRHLLHLCRSQPDVRRRGVLGLGQVTCDGQRLRRAGGGAEPGGHARGPGPAGRRAGPRADLHGGRRPSRQPSDRRDLPPLLAAEARRRRSSRADAGRGRRAPADRRGAGPVVPLLPVSGRHLLPAAARAGGGQVPLVRRPRHRPTQERRHPRGSQRGRDAHDPDPQGAIRPGSLGELADSDRISST